MAAPKLRFKDSEGRGFPKWENNRLGSLVGKISSGKDKPSDGDFILYGSTGIIGKCEHPTYKGRKILIARVGANAGFANLVNEECGVSDNTLIIKDSESCILNWLFFSIIQKNLGKMRFGSGQPLVTGTMLYNLALKVPSLPEQQKIADFLTTYDTMINTQTKRVETMKTRKKGLLQKIFSQKIRFKDEQGQDYPAWKAETLCKCCTINPPSPKLPNTFIYIDLESVKQGRLLAKKIVLAKDAPSRAQRKVIVGDVLFQTVRPYQKNNFIVKTPETIPMIASTGYSVLRCNKNNSGYIYHETQTEKFSRNVHDRCTGGAYPAITGKELGKIKIPLPSLPEQQKIADFLTAVDHQIEVEEKRLGTMKTIKKGLLQQMFI